MTLVPTQRSGWNTGASKRVIMPTRHDAILLYSDARKRLLDINQWYRLCGHNGAKFQITDENGHPIDTRFPQHNNLIRIDLPAPPNGTGKGYDWVRFEKFEEEKDLLKDEEIFGFRVRPVKSPLERDKDPAHFYTSEATSSFVIIRSGAMVSALERGRNEHPNTGVTGLLNRLRNRLVALAAMAGFAKPQWQKLVSGILFGPPQT